MSRVYFGLSGSDANETNIKLIWYYNNILGRPDKKKIISRWRGYHGSGVMTGSLTGLALFHHAFDLPRAPVLHTEAPYYFRRPDRSMSEEQFSQYCADKLEEMILAEGPDTVAAFIGEPILGTGGIVPPPKGYWQKIQAVLDKYDVMKLPSVLKNRLPLKSGTVRLPSALMRTKPGLPPRWETSTSRPAPRSA